MVHESGEFRAVSGQDAVEASVDFVTELGEVVVVTTVEHVSFDEFPPIHPWWADGTKEIIAVVDGVRESELSWNEVLLNLKSRGLE